MLERKEYNKTLDKERLRQMENISKYLEQFIAQSTAIREKPIFNESNEEELKEIEAIPIPKKGRDSKEVGDEIVNKILGKSMMLSHPRFMSFVTTSVSPYSLAGSILTDIYNPNIAGFELCPASALIEEKLIKWMGSLAGFDENCGGLFTSGGSLSNLTGMICGRENKLPGRKDLAIGAAFLSNQAHSSIYKGMKLMGLRDDQIFKIDTDDDFKIKIDELEIAIKKAISQGLKPFLVVGTLGTTNTGTIDPFDKIGEIAKKYDMWFHIDGAFGGSTLLSDIYRNLAKGIELADSFSWDLHKWAMQAYSCSAIIAKDKQNLITAFSEHPEYLEDVRNEKHNDGWDLGIEMSRPARCIKFWYTLQAMGTDLLADVVDYAFYNAKIAAKKFKELPDWELVSKPSCGTINVRYAPSEVAKENYDALNSLISKKLLDSGYAYIVTTILKGKRVIRICILNGNTETEDVLNTIEYLNNIALEAKKEFIK